MTVAAIVPRVIYQGNGATTEFSFTFEADALLVFRITISTLERVLLTLDVDYSVDFETGEVTYPLVGSPLTSSYILEIRRSQSVSQATSYSTQGNFSPASLEDALDYVTMLVQNVWQVIGGLGSPDVLRIVSYTVATLPSAIDCAPALIYVRDASGGGIPCFSDGTNWRRVDTRGIVS